LGVHDHNKLLSARQLQLHSVAWLTVCGNRSISAMSKRRSGEGDHLPQKVTNGSLLIKCTGLDLPEEALRTIVHASEGSHPTDK
jgi:hypothetical protein